SATLSLSDTGDGDFTFYGLTINNASSSSLPPPLTYNGTGPSTVYIRGNVQSYGGSGNLQDIVLSGGTGGVVLDRPSSSISISDNSAGARGIEFDSNARLTSNTVVTLIGRKLLMDSPLSTPTHVLTVPIDATLNGGGSTTYVIGKLLKNFD